MEPLRRAIAAYVNLERGAQATPERVLVLTSSQQAMTLCATVLLDAMKAVIPILVARAFWPGTEGIAGVAAVAHACRPKPAQARALNIAWAMRQPIPIPTQRLCCRRQGWVWLMLIPCSPSRREIVWKTRMQHTVLQKALAVLLMRLRQIQP